MTIDDLEDGLIERIKHYFSTIGKKGVKVTSGFDHYDFDESSPTIYIQIDGSIYYLIYDIDEAKFYLIEEVHYPSNDYYEPPTDDLVDVFESEDFIETLEFIVEESAKNNETDEYFDDENYDEDL